MINMSNEAICKGLAFIVEGATEKVFYLEYITQLCNERGFILEKDLESQEDCYKITSNSNGKLVMMACMNSVTQMTNSATWFHRACVEEHPNINWTVFLCYDTDEYNSDITKFHKGDWLRLRNSIKTQAGKIVDVAAEADIEDVMLCDLRGILSFLGLPPTTEIPPGNKGKTKLKKLYRMVAIEKACHSGERAKNLIASLNMSTIRDTASIPLKEIDTAIGET